MIKLRIIVWIVTIACVVKWIRKRTRDSEVMRHQKRKKRKKVRAGLYGG